MLCSHEALMSWCQTTVKASTDYAYILSVGLSVYKNVTQAATASSI